MKKSAVKLIVQPEDGVTPLFSAITAAKERVDIAIFRFDRRDLEKALKAAVERGVKVNAFIACTNRGGEKNLRGLETRLLQAGVTVTRSADDLIRYHSKVAVIDRRTIYVLSFNFTYADIDRSRGFGIIAEDPKWVAEGMKLLEADSARTPYKGDLDTFVVSPVNARRVLANFLKRARKQLLIYDPKISDKEMIRILQDRAKHGVDIRIIGQADADLPTQKLSKIRLHTRTIIRDGKQVFIGSQSLHATELDSRREIGLILSDRTIITKIESIFESDWSATTAKRSGPSEESTEKAMQVLTKELHPIAMTVRKAVKKVVERAGDEVLEEGAVKDTVKKVLKKVVKQAMKEAV